MKKIITKLKSILDGKITRIELFKFTIPIYVLLVISSFGIQYLPINLTVYAVYILLILEVLASIIIFILYVQRLNDIGARGLEWALSFFFLNYVFLALIKNVLFIQLGFLWTLILLPVYIAFNLFVYIYLLLKKSKDIQTESQSKKTNYTKLLLIIFGIVISIVVSIILMILAFVYWTDYEAGGSALNTTNSEWILVDYAKEYGVKMQFPNFVYPYPSYDSTTGSTSLTPGNSYQNVELKIYDKKFHMFDQPTDNSENTVDSIMKIELSIFETKDKFTKEINGRNWTIYNLQNKSGYSWLSLESNHVAIFEDSKKIYQVRYRNTLSRDEFESEKKFYQALESFELTK